MTITDNENFSPNRHQGFENGHSATNDEQTRGLQDAPRDSIDEEILGLVGPEILARRIEIAFGKNREDKLFRTIAGTVQQLLARLTTFRTGQKDGDCILSGGLIIPDACPRIKKNMVRNCLMMFDYDNGATLDEIADLTYAAGYFGYIHTTHSHMKPETIIAESKILPWLKKNGHELDSVKGVTVEQAIDFLKKTKGVRSEVFDGHECTIERVHEAGGMKFKVTHGPMSRCRAILVLKDDYDFAKRCASQAAALAEWERLYCAVAEKIGATYDSSCSDPSRLMYLPAKAPGTPDGLHLWQVVSGAMVDLDALPLQAVRDAGAGTGGHREFKTKGLLKFAAEHANDFEAADWMRSVYPEGIRHDHGDKIDFECPNEDGHTEQKADDRAFMAVNASASAEGGFYMGCLHDGCKQASGGDRLWFLDLACVKYGVPDAAELVAFCPHVEQKAEDARAEQAKASSELDTAIAALTADSTPEEIGAVLKLLIASKADRLKEDTVLRAIRDRTGKTMGVLRNALRDLRAAQHTENIGENAFDGHPPPQDLSNVAVIWSHWDHRIQARAAELTFKAKNAKEPFLFDRPEGGCVGIDHSEEETPKLVNRDDGDAWHVALNEIFEFKTIKRGIVYGVAPFRGVVTHMKAKLSKRLPILQRVVTVPIFGPEGTLHVTEDYDQALKVYLKPKLKTPDGKPDVFMAPPAIPSKEDVDYALGLLLEALRDFPFTDAFGGQVEEEPIRKGELDSEGHPLPNWERGKCSRMNMVALYLQTFVRPMISGACPAYHLDKSAAGTGASLLAQTLAHIVEGRDVETLVLSAVEEEMRKNVMAFLRTGDGIMFFDNINHHVDSGTLASALTAGTWRDRLLGHSEQLSVPVKAAWLWAGNNVSFSHELLRRNIPIRQDAAVPSPTRDRNVGYYKYPQLLAWIDTNRKRLVWACHTLIQNWIVNHRARWGSARLESFTEWSGILSGILEAAGVPPGVFLGNIGSYLKEKDEDGNSHETLARRIDQIFQRAAFKTNELFTALEGNPMSNPLPDLGIVGANEQSKLVSLGNILSKQMEGKTFRLEAGPDGNPRTAKLIRVGQSKPKKYALLPTDPMS